VHLQQVHIPKLLNSTRKQINFHASRNFSNRYFFKTYLAFTLVHRKEGNVGFHMSSVLGDAIFESNGHSKATGPIFPTDWFIYDEMQK